MADTLVKEFEALEKRWDAEHPIAEVIALARSSKRWDVAKAAFEHRPRVWQEIACDQVLFRAESSLTDYLETSKECGVEIAEVILGATEMLAFFCGFPQIWRKVFEGHLTPEKLDETFPLIPS